MDILVLSLVAGMVVVAGLWMATRPTGSHEKGPEDRRDDGAPAYKMDDGPLGQENAARVASAADENSPTGE